jgi:hypothetical protein
VALKNVPYRRDGHLVRAKPGRLSVSAIAVAISIERTLLRRSGSAADGDFLQRGA